jgi:hypothetical protein
MVGETQTPPIWIPVCVRYVESCQPCPQGRVQTNYGFKESAERTSEASASGMPGLDRSSLGSREPAKSRCIRGGNAALSQ